MRKRLDYKCGRYRTWTNKLSGDSMQHAVICKKLAVNRLAVNFVKPEANSSIWRNVIGEMRHWTFRLVITSSNKLQKFNFCRNLLQGRSAFSCRSDLTVSSMVLENTALRRNFLNSDAHFFLFSDQLIDCPYCFCPNFLYS